MKSKNILKLAVYAGEMMLMYGAETYRVEDTIRRICISGGIPFAESFVTPTGIFVSVEDANGEILSMIKRIENRSIDLNKVSLINDFSRQFAKGKISVEEGFIILDKIKTMKKYNVLTRMLCGGVGSAFFTLIFGGTYMDSLATLVIATVVEYILIFLDKYNLSLFFINILGGFVTAIMSIGLVNIGLGNNIDKVIIGTIMTMVPGVALTNAIRDTISGDLVSGSSRAEEALIIAIAVAAGIGSILNLYLKFWR